MKNFRGSIIFTVVCLFLAGLTGYYESGVVSTALQMVFVAAVLGTMETSLSLDNAVVNAAILKDMDPIWRRRFLTWGLLIAVFGMRVLFPVLIVAFSAWVWPWEAARIAVMDHERYEQIVTAAHVGISGFGGSFLLMVGLKFFLDEDREHPWISAIEKPFAAIAGITGIQYILSLLIVALISLITPHGEGQTFLIAGVSGIATYAAVQKFSGAVGGKKDATGAVVRSGLGTFMYLEVLDASFSFDGVIGAFAITNDIVIIALGLGIGAMFVRSMTIALVNGGHMSEYRYLEPGAFYAIMALAFIMLLSVRIHTPEVVTGFVGAGFIGAALWWSIRHKRLHPGEYEEDGEADAILPDGDVIPGVHTR